MLSRVADSLYWMSRYLERAEHAARLLAVRFDAMLEEGPREASRRWARTLGALWAEGAPEGAFDAGRAGRSVTFEKGTASSLLGALVRARDNARQIREEISAEMWETLNAHFLALQAPPAGARFAGEPVAFYEDTVRVLHLWRGLAADTMHHGEGWRWLELGRLLERTVCMCRLLATHGGTAPREAGEEREIEDLVLLLRGAGALEAYNRVHTARYAPERVAGFLVLDQDFPRSVRFCVDGMHRELEAISGLMRRRQRCPAERLAARLRAEIDFARPEDLAGEGLGEVMARAGRGCADIHEAVTGTYFAYSIEDLLAG